MITRRILASLLLTNFVLASLVVCYGQTRKLKRPLVLERAFQDWNSKQKRYYKGDYSKSFKEYIEQQARLEPTEWSTERVKLWDQLPDTLVQELRLSTGAEQLLESLYSENADEFERQYKGYYAQELQVNAKLYLIFAVAQKFAEESQSKEIQPSHIFRAIMAAFTGLWPFCPKKNR